MPKMSMKGYTEQETRREEHREYLNELRERGETNMFGAGVYLQAEFGLSKREASAVLMQWMQGFGDEREAVEAAISSDK